MKAKLSSREAYTLYAVVLVFLTGFYVAGLYLGRDYFVQAETDPAPASRPDLSKSEPERRLEFYDDLSTPEGEPGAEVESGSKPAAAAERAPEGTASGAAVGPATPEPPPAAEVQRPAASPREPAAASAERSGGGFTVQVGAFATQGEADQLLLRLQAYEFEGTIQPPTPAAGDHFYHVWVGRFPDRNAARSTESDLKSKGFPTFIKRLN